MISRLGGMALLLLVVLSPLPLGSNREWSWSLLSLLSGLLLLLALAGQLNRPQEFFRGVPRLAPLLELRDTLKGGKDDGESEA